MWWWVELRLFSRHIITLLLLALLAGCGFHLRGSVELPQGMQRLALTGSASVELTNWVRRALYSSGVVVVEPEESKYRLRLSGERFDRRVISLTATGKAREYALTLVAGFSLLDQEGKPLIESQLGSSGEEARIKSEMRREAAVQILQRLRAQAIEAGL